MTLVPNAELDRIERDYADGVTSVQLLELLAGLGVKISEPTFRKYVQLGLLPRSKRVGQKGKHKGSQGIYPISAVRRILEIKAMMESDLTLEEIATRVLRFRGDLDQLNEVLESLVSSFLSELRRPGLADDTRRALAREIKDLESLGDELLKLATGIEARLADPGKRDASESLSEPAADAPRIGLKRA